MFDIAPEALPRLHFEDVCAAATQDELPAASFTLVSGTCGCQTAREETLAREIDTWSDAQEWRRFMTRHGEIAL
jgi:hypothetical protein